MEWGSKGKSQGQKKETKSKLNQKRMNFYTQENIF